MTNETEPQNVTDDAAKSEASQSEAQQLTDRVNNRSQRPQSAAFREFIASQWESHDGVLPARSEGADFARERRVRLAEAFPGQRLVIPAGPLKVRSNDTDYRFRPHTAFAHLTGLGMDREPDAVLVIDPSDDAANPGTLYFRPRAGADTEEFFSDSRYGEFWVGARPTVEQLSAETGITVRHINEFSDALAKDAGADGIVVRVVPGSDEDIEAQVEIVRGSLEVSEAGSELTIDEKLAEVLSELRLCKDEWEIAQMREAIAITVNGFEDIVRNFPRAIGHRRGERVVEGAFEARAREEGNGLGYETIAASGNHACTLHWIRNDGVVVDGDLILVDAGAEADSLFTADITRTLPVNGKFNDTQREIYEAVLEAADAVFEVAKPGLTFRDLHATAMKVIARRLEEWGVLPCTAEESLAPEGQFHRRWMVHGTSHHLGMDVHDCAQARREMYLDKVLEPGMIFTIEPGLYFREDDLAVPERFRGIGIRIEDDVLITADGNENLSAALPRTVDGIERWMAGLA